MHDAHASIICIENASSAKHELIVFMVIILLQLIEPDCETTITIGCIPSVLGYL